jgi:organic hydroperoxide reductase OsmC/OhrA
MSCGAVTSLRDSSVAKQRDADNRTDARTLLTRAMNKATAQAMSDSETVHVTTIDWSRGTWANAHGKYSREHTMHFVGGTKLKASDSPFMLPEAYRDKARLNAENLFVASVSSAHMLSFLHLAFGIGVEVLSYRDEAHVVLTEVGDDHWISEVILHPKVVFEASFQVSDVALAQLHEQAQEHCFIARSIKSKVTVHRA